MKIYAVKKYMPFYTFLLFLIIFISACAKNPVTGERELVLISEEDELSIGVKNYPA